MVWAILSIAFFLAILTVFFFLWFYRDPERTAPWGKNIVSPADGRIIEILRIDSGILKVKKGIFGKINTLSSDTISKGYLISIFMSPFNVHVNRAPVDGEVLSVRHPPGTFIKANTLEAINNEKNEIIIKNSKIGKVKVIQVAGFLARRTVCSVKEKQKIKKGQRIGLIKLGSQVCLIIPELKLKANVGDRVKAGETILAEY